MSEDTDSQCKKEELEKIPKYKILNEGRYYILTVTGVLMIASILLITTTSHIYNAKKCDLKKALDSLDLKYTSQPCKYYGMKEISHEIFKLGKGVLSWNFIAFIGILFLHFGPSLKYKHVCVNISCGVITFIALLIFILCLLKYNKVAKTREETTEINYSQIESAMLTGLEKYYTSDDMNNSDYRSLSWNTFFIQYDCCGVREFQESTNDFKNTPWCKSSGTCQTGTSKIPKTCCKDVTKNDYQNAPSSCYVSAKSGTYKPSCSSRMKKLSDYNISECHVLIVSISLLIIAVLQIFEAILIAALFVPLVLKHLTFFSNPKILYRYPDYLP
ncbi:uncharacterized protein LOC111123564 isoform X1 [Crassostrea virginica]